MNRWIPLLIVALLVPTLAMGCTNTSNETAEQVDTNTEMNTSTGAEAPAEGYPGQGQVLPTVEAPAEGYPSGGEGAAAADADTDADTDTETDDGAEAEAPAEGNTVTFVVQTDGSEATYTVDEEFFQGAVDRLGVSLGETQTIGVTSDVQGEFTLDMSDVPQIVSGQIVADISKLASDQDRRDQRLREEGLASATYPLATFDATAIEGFPADYVEGEPVTFQLLGDMTIREVTNPEAFEVTATVLDGTLEGVATTTILMTDYGFDPPSFMGMFDVGDEVLVTVNLLAQAEEM